MQGADSAASLARHRVRERDRRWVLRGDLRRKRPPKRTRAGRGRSSSVSPRRQAWSANVSPS